MNQTRNIEYFKKLQEFLNEKKSLAQFKIMYKTYWDKDASKQIENNYLNQIKNLSDFKQEDDFLDDDYDDYDL